jgi:hypothetical protein
MQLRDRRPLRMKQFSDAGQVSKGVFGTAEGRHTYPVHLFDSSTSYWALSFSTNAKAGDDSGQVTSAIDNFGY